MKPRTSIIWKIPKKKLQEVVSKSLTLTDVLNYFKLINKGRNSHTLKARFKEDKIDYSHIPLGLGHGKGRSFGGLEPLSLKDIMVENSNYDRGHLKKRLLKLGILENKCYICGLKPEWNSKLLTLQLDHKNGISNDHRKTNLRILCPNCHAQTHTFTGAHCRYNISRKPSVVREKKKVITKCECGKRVCAVGRRCPKCAAARRRKFVVPATTLKKQVKELGYSGTARLYNVSDNAVKNEYYPG
jgi:hypothetical protein